MMGSQGSHTGLPLPPSCAIVAQADAEGRDAADALAAHYAAQGLHFSRAEMLHAVDAIRALLRRQSQEAQQ